MHPSSALSILSSSPKWILFIEVLTTSQTYLLNSIQIPEKIVNKFIKTKPIRLVKQWIVGKETAKVLQLGRRHCRLEMQLQEGIDQDLYIDFNKNDGTVSLNCSANVARSAILKLDEAISTQRRWIDLDEIEFPLSEINSTCVIIRKGGSSAGFLFHGEFTSLLIKGVPDTVEPRQIEEVFKKYGEVVKLKKFFNSKCWGKVTFSKKKEATIALENYKSDLMFEIDFADIFVTACFNQDIVSSNVNRECVIKATWTRIQAKGDFAFIIFENQDMYDEFYNTSKTIGGKTYFFKKAKNPQPLSLKITGINAFVNREELKSSIENQFPHIQIKTCVVPTNGPLPIENKNQFDLKRRQLTMHLNNSLTSAGDVNRLRVEMIPVKYTTQLLYEAKIRCQNANDCQKLMATNICMGAAKVRMTPELQSDIVSIPSTTFHFIENDIQKLKTTLEIKLTINEKKHTNRKRNEMLQKKQVEISIQAKEMDQLQDANVLLLDLVKGEQVRCNERQFRFFTTPIGREFINYHRNQNTCEISLKPRQRSIVVFGSLECRQKLGKLLRQKRDAMDQLNHEAWTANFAEKPVGFIKKFIKKYGYDLEKLYNITKVNLVNINFLCHTIEFEGSKESLQKCKDAVQELSDEINEEAEFQEEMDGDRRECPICFDTIETTSHQLEICSHSYCVECFKGMCHHAVQNKALPVVCAEDGCDIKVSVHDLMEVLHPQDLVPGAVERFVARNEEEYKYCTTPDCMNIYCISRMPSPDEPFHCVLCEAMICTYCHKPFHAGLPCELLRRAGDDGLAEWLTGDKENRGLCPVCTAPIERTDGCNHINCLLCRKHICWRCKKAVFESAADCYQHLSTCGGDSLGLYR